VRVFQDGVELDVVDPRTGGARDVGEVQLWTLERVSIEQAAGEVRVHLRTWTVQRTTASTRVDVSTGDEDTNVFRGFFGRRFGNGVALQLAAQQLGTGSRNRRLGGGGNAVGAVGRFGWSRGRWSADAFANRVTRSRDATIAIDSTPLSTSETSRTDAYLRAAYGTPDGGAWAQVLAGTLAFRRLVDDSIVVRPATDSTRADTTDLRPDTSASRMQYVVAAGFTRWGARFSATNRLRVFDGRTINSPSLRVGYERPWLAASAYGERVGLDSSTRIDLAARVTPLPWAAVLASVSRTSASRDAGDVSRSVARLEAGGRVGRLWLTGGRIVRDGAVLIPPLLYERFAEARLDRRASGTTFGARGLVYRAVGLDVAATAWDEAGLYRPRFDARSELTLATNWLSRFPSGTFGIVAHVRHEYRSSVAFPTADESVAAAGASGVLSSLLEIRIQQAVLSWQLRNITAREYYLVPGFQMPGPLNYYGVRWEFWN
jgi:hypothetical protein